MSPLPPRMKPTGQLDRMRAAWPAHQWTDTYRTELERVLTANADHPDDVVRAVTEAIDAHEGRFPPSLGDMRALVLKAKRERTWRERESAKRETAQPHEPWRGWLASAATVALALDAEAGLEPTPLDANLIPYLHLVRDLGYTNAHGCAAYVDADGTIHGADLAYDANLHAAAVAGAEQIWRAQGMPEAPPLGLVAA